jgi:hypothetical protein
MGMMVSRQCLGAFLAGIAVGIAGTWYFDRWLRLAEYPEFLFLVFLSGLAGGHLLWRRNTHEIKNGD